MFQHETVSPLDIAVEPELNGHDVHDDDDEHGKHGYHGTNALEARLNDSP